MSLLRTETNQGKQCVFYNNYKFRRDKLVSDAIAWRCTHSKCCAAIRTDLSVTQVTMERNEHNHKAYSDLQLQKQIIKSECKRKASEDFSSRPMKIVESVLIPFEKRDMMKELRQAIYRQRKKISANSNTPLDDTAQELSQDDIKTEDICWVSETVSSEDSSHSANPLALEDESNPIPEAPSCSTTLLEPSLIISDVLPSSSKEAEITPVPTVTLATNILPPPNQQLVPSQTALSSSNELVASPTHILGTDMMLPPKQLVLSKSVLSTEQGSCVNQSLSITNNKSGVENIPLEVCEVSFEPANKQLELDETLPNTDRIDTALRRLEDISDKVNQLNETNDNFDSFGRYVASLLRSLPIQNVVTVQQDVLSLIFRSCAQPPADQDEPTKGTSTLDKVPGTSSVTQNSSGEPPNSTETQQIPQNSSVASPKLSETQQPPPSTSPTPQNTSVHQCISVAQQNVKRNKRSHVECEILPEIRTKQSKIDESLIHTNQIDASLKRLKDISKRVKESSLWDDAFDKFGRYIASLLRCTDPQSTIGLQNEIVDLIMKSRALHLDHV